MNNIIENKDALKFMLSGKAEFTMVSLKTMKHLSFRLIKKTDNLYWLFTKDGKSMVFAGTLVFKEKENCFFFSQGGKGKLSINDTQVKSILWVLNKLVKNIFDIPVEIHHVGKCGCCGRKLTTPESIKLGLGPICFKYM